MSGYNAYWFKQLVTALQMNDAFQKARTGLKSLFTDHAIEGITHGLTVSGNYVGTVASFDLTVDVAAGAGKDNTGLRMYNADISNVDCSVDYAAASTAVAAGNHRCVTVFAKWVDVESEAHTDGAGGTVYRVHTDGIEFEVRMGSETLLANPLDYPAEMPGYLLLADITLINGQTQITDGDVSHARSQSVWIVAGTPHALRQGRMTDALTDIIGWINSHFDGSADKHDAADIVAAAEAGTPANLGYTGTIPGTGTSQSFFAELLAYVNDHFNAAANKHPSSDITALVSAGTPYTLSAGSVRSQLLELQVAANEAYAVCLAARVDTQAITTATGDFIRFTVLGYDDLGTMLTLDDDAAGTNFSVNPATDLFASVGSDLVDNDAVRFTTTDTLPAPLVAGTTYYVRDVALPNFKIAATPGGGAIDITTAGVGTHSIHEMFQRKIILPETGKYQVNGWGEFASSALGDYRELYLETDGGVYIKRDIRPPVGGGYLTSVSISIQARFVAGEYLRLFAGHNTGSDLDIRNVYLTTQHIGD